jgi:hypothetical protein
LTTVHVAGPAHAFPGHPGDEVIPWLDQPAPNPVPQIAQRQLVWEELDSWLTPADEFFIISHYTLRRSIRRPIASTSAASSRGRSRSRWPTSGRARDAR